MFLKYSLITRRWNKPFVWTEDDVAVRLRISVDEVCMLVEQGKLTAARVGSHSRFTERDISRFLTNAGSRGHPRRTSFTAGVAIAVLCVVSTAWAYPAVISQWGAQLYQAMYFSSAPTQLPALDTSVGLYRTLTTAESATGGTAQNLSLYMESLHNTSLRYVWPLYVELNTNHTGPNNDAVGMYSRLRNSGTGWATGVHSEAIVRGVGTNIGYNAEMSPMVPGGRTIGLNIQTKNGYRLNPQVWESSIEWGSEAINIQSDHAGDNASGTNAVGWETGVKFDGTKVVNGIHFTPSSEGQRAIWLQGNYTVGLDMGNLPIRLNAGTPIKLEETGQISILFNMALQRIEFRNGSQLLGYISALGDASGGKLN